MGRLYSAFVEVGPKFTGFGEIKRAGDKAGKQFGEALTDAAEKAAKANVRRLGETLAKARSGEADAAGKVRVAEAKLNEVRANSKAKASQLAAAEESLASAQRKSATASDTAADASKALDKARDRVSKTADSAGAKSGNRFSRAFKGRLSKMGGDREGKQFASRFGVGMNGAIGGIVSKSAGVFAAGFAGIAAGGFLKDAVAQASNLGETMSKSSAVFGTSNKLIEQFAATSAKSLGQSKQEATAAAAQFGNMFNQLGIGQKPAAQMSLQMVTLASDFASFHNADITEVLEAQNAAFRGEYDAVQKFVPTINAAAVEQEGLRLKLAGSTKELTAQDKAVATQSLLMSGAGKAVGDFAKTSGGLANQQRILKAQFADSKAELGQGLLPIATKFFTFLNQRGIPALKEVSGGFRAFGAAFKANDGDITSSGFPGFMERLGLTARTAFDYFKANVLPRLKEFGGYIKGTVIPIIKELVQDRLAKMGEMFSSIKQAIQENRPELERLGGTLLKVGRFLAEYVAPAFEKMNNNIFPQVGRGASILIHIIGGLVKAFGATKGALTTAFNSVKGAITTALSATKTAVSTAIDSVKGAFSTAFSAVSGAVSSVVGAVQGAFTTAVGFIKNTWASIVGVVAGPVNAVLGVLNSIWIRISPILALPFYIAKKIITETFAAIRTAFTAVAGWVTGAFSSAWAAVSGVLSGPINTALGGIRTAWARITAAFSAAKTWATGAFRSAWSAVKGVVSVPVSAAKTALDGTWAKIKGAFSTTKTWATTTFSRAWGGLKAIITTPIAQAKQGIETILGAAKGGLRYVFSTAVSSIGAIWNRLQNLAKVPIRFIVKTVLNDGLIAGFNWIAGKFEAPKIAPIPMPKGLAEGGYFNGRLPGPPSDKDNLMGYSKGGAFGLAGGEFVVKARQTAKNLPLLRAINDGDGFADGGLFGKLKDGITKGFGAAKEFGSDALGFLKDPVKWFKDRFTGPLGRLSELGNSAIAQIVTKVPRSLASTITGKAKSLLGLGGGNLAGTMNWGRSQAGKPYVWGGVGPNGYDCSGFISALINYAKGRNPYSRLGATGSMPWGEFQSGTGPFQVGWFKGNPGHTAATINGVNFESRGGRGVVVGPAARGAYDGLFTNRAKVKGFASGGQVGDAPFDLLNPRGNSYLGNDVLKQIGVYDRGGRWPSGTLGINTSGKTETVVPGDGTVRLHPADIKALGKELGKTISGGVFRLVQAGNGAYILQQSNG